MKERFAENNIEYILAENGMYYPNLQLPEDSETRPIGLYGALRKTYLKEHRPALYMESKRHLRFSSRPRRRCEAVLLSASAHVFRSSRTVKSGVSLLMMKLTWSYPVRSPAHTFA